MHFSNKAKKTWLKSLHRMCWRCKRFNWALLNWIGLHSVLKWTLVWPVFVVWIHIETFKLLKWTVIVLTFCLLHYGVLMYWPVPNWNVLLNNQHSKKVYNEKSYIVLFLRALVLYCSSIIYTIIISLIPLLWLLLPLLISATTTTAGRAPKTTPVHTADSVRQCVRNRRH